MKKFLQLSTLLLLVVTLCATLVNAGPTPPSGLWASLDIDGLLPCDPGVSADEFVCPSGVTVYINGTDYPHSVDVLITTIPDGTTYYEAGQTAPQGNLHLPQNFDAGTYKVEITRLKGKNPLYRSVNIIAQ